MRVVSSNYSTDPCPGTWVRDPAEGHCSRQGGSGLILESTWSAQGVSYSEVRGSLTGRHYGDVNGFGSVSSDINGYYVDGLSITVNDPSSGSGREHVHTYALGLTSSSAVSNAGKCPADGGYSPPAFVGNDYSCASGNSGTSWSPVWYSPVLFEGTSFQKQLSSATTETISARIISNESPTAKEDFGVRTLELLIR